MLLYREIPLKASQGLSRKAMQSYSFFLNYANFKPTFLYFFSSFFISFSSSIDKNYALCIMNYVFTLGVCQENAVSFPEPTSASHGPAGEDVSQVYHPLLGCPIPYALYLNTAARRAA